VGKLVPEQAVLAGRIRDALRGLGFPVPAGSGPATVAELAACVPAIEAFVRAMGARFEREVKAAETNEARARLIAERAESVCQMLGPVGMSFVRIARGVMEGVTLLRSMNTEVSSLAGIIERFTAAKSR
jgi:hypothetical protein